MINGIESSSITNFFYSTERKENNYVPTGSINSFEVEDQAVISAQAKLLNELEKYNTGKSDELNLALTCVTSKNQIKAVAEVINTKKEIFETVLDIAK